jgi:hypothetical protein
MKDDANVVGSSGSLVRRDMLGVVAIYCYFEVT